MKKFLAVSVFLFLMAGVSFGFSSSDTELILSRLDKIDARLDALEASTAAQFSAVNVRLDKLAVEISHTNDRLEDLRHMIYWGFAIIGIVIALMTLPRGGAPKEKGNSGGVTISDMIAFFNFAKEKEKS